MSIGRNRPSLKAHDEKRGPQVPFGSRVMEGIASALFEAYYRVRLGFSVKPGVKPLERGEMRTRLVRSLDYLSGMTDEGAAYNEGAVLSNGVRKTRERIRTKWNLYYWARPFSSDHHQELTRWDLLSVYPDEPFSSLFDLGRHVSCLPVVMQNEYHRGKASGKSLAIEGEAGTSFFAVLKRVCELQLGWAAKLFLMPPPLSGKTGMHRDLFGFSGHLLSGLLSISELIDLSAPGAAFHQDYHIRLNESIARNFGELGTAGATFADHLFLHGAFCRLWAMKVGMSDRDGLLLPFETKRKCSAFLRLSKDKPLCDAVLVALRHNPVSNLLLGPLFSDMNLFQDFGDIPAFPIDRFLRSVPSHETLSWLADYASSLLVSPYGTIRRDRHKIIPTAQCSIVMKEDAPKPGTKRSEVKSYIQRSLLCRRFLSLASLINPPKEGNEDRPAEPPRPFLQGLYEFLLREWLQEKDGNGFPSHPLPRPDRPPIPARVKYAHFSVDEKQHGSHDEILALLRRGEGFDKLAVNHSDEHLVRASQGCRGWIGRGEVEPVLERALFLFPTDGVPFYTQTEGRHHYLFIQERENSPGRNLLERLTLWAQVDEDLRNGALAFFAPLHSLMDEEQSPRAAMTGDLLTLYREARFYLRLIASDNMPFCPI